jgi:AcrR family transcriptional regulator
MTAVLPARGRGRPKALPDETVAATVTAQALALFMEVGYAGTTMDALAARCRMSKRTLYRLFPSKGDVFKAVIALHRQSMLDLPQPDDERPLTQALEAIFRIDIDDVADRNRIAFIRLVVTEADRFPEVEDLLWREGAEASRRLLADWLARQAERGRIAVADPLAHARILMDMVFGHFARRRMEERAMTGAQRRAHLRAAIDIFVNGVARR